VFTVSVIPDIDLLFNSFTHRGETHSLFVAIFVFLPFFVLYKKKTIPYFIAFLSHSLIGDILSRGTQIFWPFSTEFFYFLNLSNRSWITIFLELFFFTVSIVLMLFNNDFKEILFNTKRKIYWLVPFIAVLSPLFIGSFNPSYILPRLLVIPSLFFVGLFALSTFNMKKIS
jgi:membrane-bound metal-dependent hydrolase YbcI (DUF457 family)